MMRGTLSTQSHQAQLPPGGRIPWSVALPWGLALGVLVAAGVLAFYPRGVQTQQPPPGRNGALVWGDGLFTNALELEAWLRIRGVSYKAWAQRHPAGVKLLVPPAAALAPRAKAGAKKAAPPPAKQSAKRSVVVTPPAARAPAQPKTQAQAPTQDDSSGIARWLLPALLACAGLLALLLLRFRLPAFWRWLRIGEDGERRFRSVGGYAGIGLVAVGLGFLVPLLFG